MLNAGSFLSPRALAADADPVKAIGFFRFEADAPGHEDGWVERLSFDWADNAQLLAIRLLGTGASDATSPSSSSSTVTASSTGHLKNFSDTFP